jgi:hypothetical protein
MSCKEFTVSHCDMLLPPLSLLFNRGCLSSIAIAADVSGDTW